MTETAEEQQQQDPSVNVDIAIPNSYLRRMRQLEGEAKERAVAALNHAFEVMKAGDLPDPVDTMENGEDIYVVRHDLHAVYLGKIQGRMALISISEMTMADVCRDIEDPGPEDADD